MKIGALLFDAGNHIVGADRTIVALDNAWASIGGGPARRVQSIHSLPSDVIWFTNLGYNNFQKAKLTTHPNFRNADWLRTPLNQLVSELGVDDNSVHASVTAEVLATIAYRVAKVAKDEYQVLPTGTRKLNQDFADVIQVPRPRLPGILHPLFEQAAKHPSVGVIQNVSYTVALPSVTLRRNRVTHARDLLSTPMPPDIGWELMEDMPPDNSDDWLECIETPFLVKCRVSNVKPAMAEVLSWGAGAKNAREWLTDVEWRVVRQHGTVEVLQALICSHPAEALPQVDLIPSHYCAELSVTYGLIAEQIWTAFTLPQTVRGSPCYTAAAAWLRSLDRMIMFDYAQKLYARGCDVSSYGVGSVVVRYPEGGLKRVLDIATDIGLMPPASKISELGRGVAA